MHDSDGPTLARAVYHSIFGGVSGGVASDLFISAEPSHEPVLEVSKVSLVRRPSIPLPRSLLAILWRVSLMKWPGTFESISDFLLYGGQPLCMSVFEIMFSDLV